MPPRNDVHVTLKSEFWLRWFSLCDFGEVTPKCIPFLKNKVEITIPSL